MMKKIHLDTDLGGDIDDLCALALLLRWKGDVELTGITTVAELDGRRAGYARYVLGLEGRQAIPVAAGVDNSQGFYPYALGLPDEHRYWPEPVQPAPGSPGEAIRLLKSSIDQGAAIIGIGPYTNLYLLDLKYPGILQRAELFLMGGYVYPSRPGFPRWGNEMDFNVQIDVRSSLHVLQNSHPTLVPLSVTVETALRRSHLSGLRASGSLGRLLARQAEAFSIDEKMEIRFGETCANIPNDIINFQYDPLTCAIALGWSEGVEIEELPVILEIVNGQLVERPHPSGKPIRLVTKIDGARFNEFWLNCIQGK